MGLVWRAKTMSPFAPGKAALEPAGARKAERHNPAPPRSIHLTRTARSTEGTLLDRSLARKTLNRPAAAAPPRDAPPRVGPRGRSASPRRPGARRAGRRAAGPRP